MNKAKEEKKKYLEGECESCGEYARLHEVNDEMVCEQCMDEEGKLDETEANEED